MYCVMVIGRANFVYIQGTGYWSKRMLLSCSFFREENCKYAKMGAKHLTTLTVRELFQLHGLGACVDFFIFHYLQGELSGSYKYF